MPVKPSVLFLCLVLFTAACSDKKSESKSGESKSDGGKVASCKTQTMCVEYRGGNLALGTENLEKLCVMPAIGGTFTETACSTDGVVATCARNEGKDFYYAPFTKDEVQPMCTGEFKPGT
jgi:hypothetical protein